MGQQVFLSLQPTFSTSAQQELTGIVAAANRAGFAIRVAVISSSYDLGSVTELWRKPRVYARFLGLELSSSYRGRLLVVMPNGFGFNWPGHSPAEAERQLANLTTRSGVGGLLGAGQAAVVKLADAAGVKISAPAANASGKSNQLGVVIAAAVAALAAAAALALGVRRHRRRATKAPTTEPSTRGAGAARGSLRRGTSGPLSRRGSDTEPDRAARSRTRRRTVAAFSAFAFAVGFAVAAATVVFGGSRHRPSRPAPPVVATDTPFTWREGVQRAPDFRLKDQNGRPISIASYRGRPVIVTFMDPLCRNLCPLEAHVLNALVGRLPAAQRPAIVAVSVDIWADSRADLLQDYSHWHLVPQWRWAVGSPAQLAAVWKSYKIEVTETTKKIAGATVHEIGHDEVAYVIDPAGYVRALFFWPFAPSDVERTLAQLRS